MSLHVKHNGHCLATVFCVWLCGSLVVPAPPAWGQDGNATTTLQRFAKNWDEGAWTSPNKGRDFMRPLDDDGWQVRMRCLQSFVRMGQDAVPALVNALEQGDEPTRILAAQALGYLAPHAPRDVLKKAIQADSSAVVRLYAVDSLGMQGGDWSEFLGDALPNERNRDAKMHIKYALERRSTPVDSQVVQHLRDWDSGHMNSATVGSRAPDFELSTVGGRTIRLSDFRGQQLVVLVFIYGDT